jgi:hypothetical protein
MAKIKGAKKEEYILAAVITLVLIRAFIYFSRYFMPEKHLVVYGYMIHHFWLGYPFVIAALFIKRDMLRSILAGIGTGFIADEFVFMMLGGGGYASYWALPSVIGALLCMIIIFIFRQKILFAFSK